MIITKKEEILFYSLIQTPSMTQIIPKTTLPITYAKKVG